MRKEIYRMPTTEALEWLTSARIVHLATTGSDGEPILRTLHAVVWKGAVAFHGAPAGEKMAALGRQAVVGAEEVVAGIPSYFLDPERACPATTYYRSVQAHGVLQAVADPAEKAEILAAFMRKYQPEGGHVPISADHPLYRKAIEGILIVQMPIDRLDGKAKLGQNRRSSELVNVIEKLRHRNGPGDAKAIEFIRAANGI
ncbi:MAG: pyridoxamine 5'-phosphate oxidase family protein [Cyanobacteria bacterium REEB65]|nr:pyridoxamine 5'-phosphate oxidase family protein [Cyanobacteria bacterium REEB65]